MLLLPDIRIGRNILSIQYPYTFNGDIITDIEINETLNMSMSYNPTSTYPIIYIKTENHFNYSIDSNELCNFFNYEMTRFISRYGSFARVEGSYRYININWDRYSFSDYIKDIKEQCYNINICSDIYIGERTNYTNSRYINALKESLIRQNRFESFINSNISVSGTGRFYTEYLRPENSEKPKNKYIHDYNYKPEYIYHYMPDENKDTTALFGCEIEVDCGGKSEEHAKEVLKIICGTALDDEDKVLEDKMYCTHDGSLEAGIEFDTMPCSLEYHKNEMKYREMFEYLDKNGYKAHDTTTCGLHIHVDRKYLGKSELVQQLTISKILYILEKFNDEICVIARRNNDYCKFVGKGEINKSLNKLYNKYYDTGKKVALNLQHKDSIEFRCFKGTLKYETFILTIEFVKNIVDYAKLINIEQIELIKWEDLMNTFSDELKEYYNERFEKEKNKKEENKSEKSNIARVEFINGHGIRSTITIDEMCDAWNTLVTTTTTNTTDLLGSLSSINCEIRESQELTTEKKLNKEIKSLKKKIKNSDNYLEKKNLQQELNEAQKELKKVKRKNKLNNNINTTS